MPVRYDPIPKKRIGRPPAKVDYAAVRSLLLRGASLRQVREMLCTGHGTAQRAYDYVLKSLSPKEQAVRKRNGGYVSTL